MGAPIAMRLALFDLDHTLLPLDSDYEWGRFLGRIGAVDAAWYEEENRRFYQAYNDGTLDIASFLAFSLGPLAAQPRERIDRWHEQFMREVIEPAIRPQAIELVARHRDAGDTCVIVTATNDFVTAPIAGRFGVEHLIASTTERRPDGGLTGRPLGTPSFREGKVIRTGEFLRERGLDWTDVERSWFYSDSANDIPLLAKVTDPVATNPDPRLDAHAAQAGWPVLRLFD